MATAGHLGIATPHSDGGPSERSLNPDDLSFGSQEASFKSPSKLNKENQQPANPTKQGPQTFLKRLHKPTGSTPLADIKNNPANNIRPLNAGAKQEFTPLLKSVTKAQFLKQAALASQTPSRMDGMGMKSAGIPERVMEEAEGESVMVEGETGVDDSTANLQSEAKLADMSSVSASFQKLPSRSPGSNDGAALLTLREQEKVPTLVGILLILGH
jgi:hypothetical protein